MHDLLSNWNGRVADVGDVGDVGDWVTGRLGK